LTDVIVWNFIAAVTMFAAHACRMATAGALPLRSAVQADAQTGQHFLF